MNTTISPARLYAFDVLHAVLTNGELLDDALEQHLPPDIAENNHALAREIASGTCRHLGKIRFVLNQLADRLDKFPPMLQHILELSAYQILYLDRVPDFAVVSDAVNLANQKKLRGLSKAVNGILRNLARQKDTLSTLNKTDDIVHYLSVECSHPEWLLRDWLSIWSETQLKNFCRFNNSRAPISLRIRKDMNAAKQVLRESKVTFTEHDVLPNILVLDMETHIDPALFQHPLWVVQDPVMTLPAQVMNPQPGWKIWDVCAAPGGKTFHLADKMNGKGTIFATDRSDVRLNKLRAQQDFLGYNNIQPLALNPLHDTLPPEFCGMDAILLDVPCTGWGTFRRHPDLRWRLKPDDSRLLGKTALQLLNKTTAALKKGGLVVYSTCTLSPEENENVMTRFLDENQSFQLVSIQDKIPTEWQSCMHDGCFTAFPPVTNTDGAFCACLQRLG